MLLVLLPRIKADFDRIPTWVFAAVLVSIYIVIYFFTIGNLGTPIQYAQSFFTLQFLLYVGVGFAAQMVDGALGMAYGISASTFLISTGVSPAAASAGVHVAEVFTTGASAVSHFSLRNVNKKLFKNMVIPGVLGAVVGAYILSNIDGDVVKPYVAAYLLIMGAIVIKKSFGRTINKQPIKGVGLLAAVGGFLDSIGGGGWGPVVTSTLLSRGRDPKYTIGTVNTTEFFVAFASAGIFTLFMGLQNVQVIAGLVVGGIIAAPFGALIVGKIKPRILMIMVGILIILLSLRTLIKYIPF